MKECLEIIFAGVDVSATSLWEELREYVTSKGKITLFGKKATASELIKEFKGRRAHGYNIEAVGLRVEFATVRAWNHQFLKIVDDNWDVFDKDGFVERLFNKFPTFVAACVFDSEYRYWQNAWDPRQFEGHADIAKLKTRDNGLPPPLNQMVVDTSGNPGRRELRQGYVEGIGSPMWISTRLREVSGSEFVASALAGHDFHISTRGDLVRIEYGGGQFLSEITSEAQCALRRAVFGQDIAAVF